jgi:DNA-binding MarR family transcriptional regulator
MDERATTADRPDAAADIPFVISVFRLAGISRRVFGEHMAGETWAQDAKLKPGCYGVLRIVAASDVAPSQRALSDKLGMDPSDVVGLVDVLEDAGYVVRDRDESDRRRYALRLTEAGEQAKTRFDEIAEAVSEAVLDALDPDEQAELVRLTGRVIAAQQDASADAIRLLSTPPS